MKLISKALLLLVLSPVILGADEPKTAELKELSRYLGEWKGSVQDQPQLTSTSKMEWIVKGTVLQQKYEYSDGESGIILRGYDQQSGQYFMTLMDSRGINFLLPTGSWNKATKTFKFSGYSGGNEVTVRSVFTSDDVEDWTITIAGNGGNVTELHGKNTKQ